MIIFCKEKVAVSIKRCKEGNEQSDRAKKQNQTIQTIPS